MSASPNPLRALLAGSLLAATSVVALVGSDGELATMGRCLVLGQGLAFVSAEPEDFVAEIAGKAYAGRTDNLIDIYVYAFGGYELPILHAMRDTLAARSGPGQGVVLDVGANVGTHVLFLSDHAEKVVAVEPWPPVRERLLDHIERNHLDNVLVRPVGYSDAEGKIPYHVPPDRNQGWGSFSDSFSDTKYASEDRVIQLPLVRGDDDLRAAGVDRVDLIKVDIEGFEKPALTGLADTLERDRPAVFFELNVSNAEGFKSEADLRGAFPDGYTFFLVTYRKELNWPMPGGGRLMCGPYQQHYELVPFPMDFSQDTLNLVALPG